MKILRKNNKNCFDIIIFSALCATLFTSGLCHVLIDNVYSTYLIADNLNLVDLNWVFAILSLISVYYLVKKKKILFDFELIIFIQAYVLHAVLDYNKERYTNVCYAWILPMAYIVAKLAVSTSVTIREANSRIIKLYFSLGIGWFIAATADVYNNFRLAPVNGFQTEIWPSFWIPAAAENRTTYEIGFIFITCSLGYSIYRAKKNKIALVLIILANLLIQYFEVKIEGRENRLLLPIALLIVGSLYLLDNRKSISIKAKKAIVACVVAFIIFVIFAWIAFINNWFGLHDRYLGSVWAGSGGVFTNVRFSYNLGALKSMLIHPLDDFRGYEDMTRGHSMFLEYGRVGGFSIYVLFIIFNIFVLKDIIKISFLKNTNAWIKYLIVPALIGINLYYAMEPNGYVYKSFWMLGLYLSGMLRGWLEISDKPEINTERKNHEEKSKWLKEYYKQIQ